MIIVVRFLLSLKKRQDNRGYVIIQTRRVSQAAASRLDARAFAAGVHVVGGEAACKGAATVDVGSMAVVLEAGRAVELAVVVDDDGRESDDGRSAEDSGEGKELLVTES